MGNGTDLCRKLRTYIDLKEKDVVYKDIVVCDMTLMQLRDSIIGFGTILEENIQEQIYVISIMAGTANMNATVVAIKLSKNVIQFAGYAREGFIKQHTADKAIERIKDAVRQYRKEV